MHEWYVCVHFDRPDGERYRRRTASEIIRKPMCAIIIVIIQLTVINLASNNNKFQTCLINT